MPAPAILSRAANFGLKVAAALAFLAPLASRVTVGYAFFLTGRGKLMNLDNFTEFLSALGVPFASAQAPFVAGLEFVGGIALVLGLGTRLFGAGLLGTMVVALMTADKESFLSAWSPTSDIGLLDVSPWVISLLLSWLILYGPGPVSLDKPLAKWLGIGTAGGK